MRIMHNTKLKDFQYRFLSKKITTNHLRSKWDKTVNPTCTFCRTALETITHLFYECKQISKLWTALTKWLQYMLKIRFRIDERMVVLCNYQGQHSKTINLIVLIFKQYIYATKCIGEEISFTKAMCKMQEFRKLEFIMCEKNSKLSDYYKIWGKIE